MNRLTVRDLVVMGGSFVMAVSAFLPFWAGKPDSSSDLGYFRSFYAHGSLSVTTWHWASVATLLLGFCAGVAAGVLVAIARFTPAGDVSPRIGLELGQLTAVLAVVSFLELALSGLGRPLHGVGQWLALLAGVALLVGTVLPRWVPALSTPVTGGSAGPGAAQGTFWFSVAAPTPVHDRATGSPRSNLQPGRWYLATASYGSAWEVSDQEFGTAILHDLSGAQPAR